MKIKVVPRCYFVECMGTPDELELLKTHRIISLNSSGGASAMPPFSNMRRDNLLCITVDDIVRASRGMVLFNRDHAVKILEFADGSRLPLIVHCNAGISRSGAVGEVLNWYFNCYLQRNPGEFAAFYVEHPQIVPNLHIKAVLLEVLDIREELPKGSCSCMMNQETESMKN